MRPSGGDKTEPLPEPDRIDVPASTITGRAFLSSGSRTRIASNFAILALAEIACRGVSVLVTLTLARRLGSAGYGRIEFAFNIVFWMVLVIRDCFETIVTREIARHPRLIRPLVGRVLAVKFRIALLLYLATWLGSWLAFRESSDARLLQAYGLLIISTSLGIDFVFRATERVGLVAVSLLVRTSICAVGTLGMVDSPERILLVPIWLVAGEFFGIGLVWLIYRKRYGRIRFYFQWRVVQVFLHRGASIVFIHLAQAILLSADLLIVGLMCTWSEVGRYGAPHRMVSALLAFALIFQQVVFPTLSRAWRASPTECQRILSDSVRILMMCFLPVAVGGCLLAPQFIGVLLPPEYRDASVLLRLGIWRVPIYSLAFFYQSSLIATNRESIGLRLLLGGAVVATPMSALSLHQFGLVGAVLTAVSTGLGLTICGYYCLAREGRAPSWHHHLAKPIVAALAMTPVTLLVARWSVPATVGAGALTYGAVLWNLGAHRGLFSDREPESGEAKTHWNLPRDRVESDLVSFDDAPDCRDALEPGGA